MLSTRVQLTKHGIILCSQDPFCVFGCAQVEDIRHLFITCNRSMEVWVKINSWLRIDFVAESNCCDHFRQVVDVLKMNCASKRVGVIWLVGCWCIWRQRTGIIFNNVQGYSDEIVHNVKMYSWWWLAIRTKHKVSRNFYE